MDLLIFALIVLIVCAMLVYAVGYLPLPSPFNQLIIALIIILGALFIANRAGLF